MNIDNLPIYLDNASTTMPLKEVLEEANNMNIHFYANPSSLHKAGFLAEKQISESSLVLGNLLNVSPHEIVYTSGGTEANNLAILGVAKKAKQGTHFITNVAEHSSVLKTFEHIENCGFAVTYLPLDKNGLIDLSVLEGSIESNTALVSIMHVNNETGTIQDIPKIYNTIKSKNPRTILHVDGVQGFGKTPLDMQYTDLYSFNAHKIHGLKGVGGLYVKAGIKLQPMLFGGQQQNATRPGTENTYGIKAFSIAATVAFSNMKSNLEHTSILNSYIVSEIRKLDNIIINTNLENASCYILNISILGIKAETMMNSLEQDGIYVSAGATCNSKTKDKNILRKIGATEEIAESAIRVSFSPYNTLYEAEKFVQSLKKNIEFLRRFSK